MAATASASRGCGLVEQPRRTFRPISRDFEPPGIIPRFAACTLKTRSRRGLQTKVPSGDGLRLIPVDAVHGERGKADGDVFGSALEWR